MAASRLWRMPNWIMAYRAANAALLSQANGDKLDISRVRLAQRAPVARCGCAAALRYTYLPPRATPRCVRFQVRISRYLFTGNLPFLVFRSHAPLRTCYTTWFMTRSPAISAGTY